MVFKPAKYWSHHKSTREQYGLTVKYVRQAYKLAIKKSNLRKLKEKTQTQDKTEAVKLNYGQFHSNYWIAKNIIILQVKITICAKIFLQKSFVSIRKIQTEFVANSFGLFCRRPVGPFSKPNDFPDSQGFLEKVLGQGVS